MHQLIVITALFMLILIDVDLDGLNRTLSSVDWNDVFDTALLDIDITYQRFFFLYS